MRQSWTNVLVIVLQYSYFSVISLLPLKTVQRFRNCVAVHPPPTLYKAETRKKIPDTRVQYVILCRRTLHLCNRYPFRLLVKSVSAVSGRDIMVVKLLLYFFSVCVLFSFFCGFDLYFVLVLFWLFVCMLLFLFSVSVKELVAVNSLAVI